MMVLTSPKQGLLLRALPALCLVFTAALRAADAAPPAPAPATPPPTSEEIVQLPQFNVSSESADRYRAADAVSAVRVRAPLLDTASTISVVTRTMMDDIEPNRIFDVTRFVAGVQDGRGIQFQDRMIIRGFETQNGARTVDNFLQSADADNIEESVVDRIEVTKGPNAILSPAGAPGGSVNVITKAPTFHEQRSLTALVGLYDAQKVTLDMGGPIPGTTGVAYRLVASGQDARQYWSKDAVTRGRALAPMVTWNLSDKTQLTVKVIGADHYIYREPLLVIDPAVTADTSNPFLAGGLGKKSRNGIQPWSHVGTHSADLFAVLTTSLNDHVSLRVAANGRYYFEDSDQEFLNGYGLSNRYNPYTGELTQDYTWALVGGNYVSTYSRYFDPQSVTVRGQAQWTTRKTANLQTDLASNYQFGVVSSQTIVGLAYSRQFAYNKVKDPGPLPNLDLRNPDFSVYPAYPANLTANNGSSYTNTQAYLNERLGFFRNRLYLTGGLLRYATVTKSWNELTHSTPAVLDDSKLMFTESVLWKVLDNVSVYYSHSTNSSPVIANNQPLWRSGVQDEAGVKSEFFEHRLSLNGAWFKIAQTNVTVPNPAYNTDPAHEPQTLVSDLKDHGMEFEIMGALTPNLSVIATYSYLHLRDNLGRMVRGVADNIGAVLLNYRFGDGDLKGLALDLGATYSGRRAGDSPPNFTALNVVCKTSFFLKPQYTTTFSARYVWKDKIIYRLSIDNLLDQKGYICVAGGRVSGTGLTTQPGRNIKFSTTFAF